MNRSTQRGLKIAAAAIFAALLVAMTVNVAVDFWTPQAELNEPPKVAVAPAIEPAAMQVPATTQPLPPPPERSMAVEPQWNQPLFEPKFDGPGFVRGTGSAGFTAPDIGNVLNQYAPLGQVLPPSVSLPGSAPAAVSIRPIFGGKSGGVESGAMDTAGSLSGTAGGAVSGPVGGAVSGAGALLNKR
jgi:hypothetical protein